MWEQGAKHEKYSKYSRLTEAPWDSHLLTVSTWVAEMKVGEPKDAVASSRSRAKGGTEETVNWMTWISDT